MDSESAPDEAPDEAKTLPRTKIQLDELARRGEITQPLIEDDIESYLFRH